MHLKDEQAMKKQKDLLFTKLYLYSKLLGG